MNTSGVMFDGFYDSIVVQENYFLLLRRYMEITSTLNCILVMLSCYIMIVDGKILKKSYRQVLFVNLIIPAIFSLYMGFIYQPYIVFPYHFLLTIGFFRFGPFVTAHLFNICCSVAILCSMGFIYSFWYNYITICFHISKKDSGKSNLYAFIIGVTFTAFNFVLMTIGVDTRQYNDREYIYKTDGRNQYFFETYSIAVVHVSDKWSLKALSIEAFIGISAIIVVIPVITVKSYSTLSRIHHSLSKSTLMQLKSALAISLCYLLQFGILVGLPTALAMTLLLTRFTPSTTFPLALLILAPTQLTCPTICILYLIVIKPLRNGLYRTLRLRRYAENSIALRSTQSQKSVTITVTGTLPPSRRPVNPYSSLRLY